jgi:hypothetical protein
VGGASFSISAFPSLAHPSGKIKKRSPVKKIIISMRINDPAVTRVGNVTHLHVLRRPLNGPPRDKNPTAKHSIQVRPAPLQEY